MVVLVAALAVVDPVAVVTVVLVVLVVGVGRGVSWRVEAGAADCWEMDCSGSSFHKTYTAAALRVIAPETARIDKSLIVDVPCGLECRPTTINSFRENMQDFST